MNLFWKRLVCTTLAIVTVGTAATTSAVAATPELATVSEAYVVIDAASGQVLVEKNMSSRKAPASITKVMTIALALERGGLMEDVITVGNTIPFSIDAGSTHIALEAGEVITFRDAVMATQLISANDAANVVAEYVSGNIPNFVSRMNDKVTELGLTGTHFANPNGLDAKDHYVTAYDMAQIARYALSVPGFRDIFASTEYQMPATNKKARNYKFYAQNAVMFPENREYYEGITGSKLGYTHAAKHTLVSSAKRGNMELIVVTLGSASSSGKYTDSKLLLDYCFENYESMTIPSKEIRATQVPVASVDNPISMVAPYSSENHTFVVPLGTAKSSLEIRYELPELYKSERTVDPSFSVYLPTGELVYSAKLKYNITPVNKSALSPLPDVPKPRTEYFTDFMIVAFKCLLVALGVFLILFVICRTVVMIRYSMERKRSYKKKLQRVQRKQAALERSAIELEAMEKALGVQIVTQPMLGPASHTRIPDNVTRIYPNRNKPDAKPRTSSRR